MGYESRIHIVSEGGILVWDCGKPSAEVIATFNLCKCEQEVLNVFKEEATHCLVIGNEEVTKDSYGDPLKSASIMDLYNAIEYGKYWRTTALKEFLHGIINNKDILSREFDSLKAYHYGY